MNRMKELKNAWRNDAWKRDIARYEDCAFKLRDIRFVGMSSLRNHWKEKCNEIADKYPCAKLEKF